MAHEDANRLALRAAREVLEAASAIMLDVGGVSVKVEPMAPPDRDAGVDPWPTLPGKRPLPGLRVERDGPWPAPRLLHCSWGTGEVDIEVRVGVWRGRGRYEGQLALEAATKPRNRQLMWVNLTQRISDTQGQRRCAVSVNSGLFVREGERDAWPLTSALSQSFRDAGFKNEGATRFGLLTILLPEGRVEEPSGAFERLVRAALLKLSYVTRGESNDVRGAPLVDITEFQRLAASSPPSTDTEPVEPGMSSAAQPAPEEVSAQDQLFFESVWLKHFGAFSELEWSEMGRINLVIGTNDTGKSQLLKILYVLARSVEDFTARMAADRPNFREVLADKLLWTFEPQNGQLGELVRRGAPEARARGIIRNEEYQFTLPATAGRSATDLTEATRDVLPQPRLSSLYLPPKEVLTALDAIAAVREQLRFFGFDNTYQDLVRAVRLQPMKAELPEGFRSVLHDLEALFTGRIDEVEGRFVFQRGGERFGMSLVAEGIKKIGLLARLLENGQIRPGSILFLDEPETNLHPRAARALCEMLFNLGKAGVQIFMATHSYFVLKQMQLLARKAPDFAKLCCLQRTPDGVASSFFDLAEGLPDNEIVDESLDLYEEDLRATLEE
ncbi:AAA family ATPase [Chondromyces apiculatus]|uniref:ATPase AAA-type core domain-containing protein n=1 Tax=Chondromyces apiculatus DSM 436 TaxID=1192034 RepID=A0A017T5L5_9BACT|nr:ATP-binding protein [Chondromyces apiculatus]EYF04075.1 Hypothetical protein CAP_4949 [Chondromyces apiculatus DSM 436]